jgi:Ca2+-transporting ATPase
LYERDASLPYDAIAISAVVLLNAILGYVQQERAESAIAALRQMAAARAHVIRDSQPTSIPASEVVPGDILLAEDGDALTADVRVIDATALCVSEAALTAKACRLQRLLTRSPATSYWETARTCCSAAPR